MIAYTIIVHLHYLTLSVPVYFFLRYLIHDHLKIKIFKIKEFCYVYCYWKTFFAWCYHEW